MPKKQLLEADDGEEGISWYETVKECLYSGFATMMEKKVDKKERVVEKESDKKERIGVDRLWRLDGVIEWTSEASSGNFGKGSKALM